jgi:dihydrofolate synthase/folylpolyglutamate synthase
MRCSDAVDAWLQDHAGLKPEAIELGLERVRVVVERLQVSPPAPVIITVGGTNGKGSSVAFLEAILLSAGYRVGTYTSPHLVRYAERIKVDGVALEETAILDALHQVHALQGDSWLTYFELGTLAALALFKRAALDVALLEVGLGGRLDAVNVVDPDVALVTTVDLDHQAWLGKDREAIGFEKAGIFRGGRVGVYGDRDPPDSLIEHAARVGAILWQFDRDYSVEVKGAQQWHWHGVHSDRLSLPMPALSGAHQLRNAGAALAVLEACAAKLPVTKKAIRTGLLGTKLAGRFDVRRFGQVTWILDVAHNRQAAQALRRNLAEQLAPGRTFAVFGVLSDKDAAGMVAALADQVDVWHLAAPADARALPVNQLAAQVALAVPDTQCQAYPSVESALDAVAARVAEGDRVLVFGSFVTVGDALRWLNTSVAAG